MVGLGVVGGRVVDRLIVSLALVAHVGHVSAVVVGVVLDVLGPAVGQQDGVGSLHVAAAVSMLAVVEVGAVVVVVDTVLVAVRLGLLLIHGAMVRGRGVVGGGGVVSSKAVGGGLASQGKGEDDCDNLKKVVFICNVKLNFHLTAIFLCLYLSIQVIGPYQWHLLASINYSDLKVNIQEY